MFDRVKTILAGVGAALLALVAGIFLGRSARRPMAREVDKALARTEQAVEHAGRVVEEERAKVEDRRKRAAELAKRLKRLPVVLLVAVSVGCLGPVASAQEAPKPQPPATKAQLPSDYDSLAKLYLEAVQVAAGYKQLYEEAEASNERLLQELETLWAEVQRLTQVVERQQRLIEAQQTTILALLRSVRLTAGVSLQGLSPIQVVPWVGLAFQF